jgi:hypothetical protein
MAMLLSPSRTVRTHLDCPLNQTEFQFKVIEVRKSHCGRGPFSEGHNPMAEKMEVPIPELSKLKCIFTNAQSIEVCRWC